MVGHYLGDPANPCIVVVDTPGASDTQCRDHEHGFKLKEGIQELGSITAFVMLFNGQRPRFSAGLVEQVKLYQGIFGPGMWNNVITEFTFWPHDRRSIKLRRTARNNLNEETQHTNWNLEYTQRFGVNQTIPTVFLDPVFDPEIAGEKETEIDKKEADKLWALLSQNFTKFECDDRCKAPDDFYKGHPLLQNETSIQNKRLGDKAVFTWQIWFGGCNKNGTRSYKIFHKDQKNRTVELESHVVLGHTIEVTTERRLSRYIKVTDTPYEKYKKVQLTIERVQERHFGAFFIENDKGTSADAELHKIIDGQWMNWGPWSGCSQKCWEDTRRVGHQTRRRECATRDMTPDGLDCSRTGGTALEMKHGCNDKECPTSGWKIFGMVVGGVAAGAATVGAWTSG